MVIYLISIISLLLTIAFYTIGERKLLASIQRIKGPNITGFWGLLQAFADGLKLVLKEIIVPSKANSLLFLLAPLFTLFISIIVWSIIPFTDINFLTNFDLSLLWVYAISSLGIYGIIGAGWSSNSKYAFLGGIRSSTQLISYEVYMVLLLLPVAAFSNSFNLIDIVNFQINSVWLVFPLLPLSIIFFVSILAETNRAPFDLP